MDRKATMMVRLLGASKIPMLGYARPKILQHTEDACEVLIPLRRRTKNHWNSMYLGALAVGADLCAGLPAFHALEQHKKNGQTMGFVFKSMKMEFLWRPDADVRFVAHDVAGLLAEVDQAAKDGERHEFLTLVEGFIEGRDEPVVRAEMEMSFRLKR